MKQYILAALAALFALAMPALADDNWSGSWQNGAGFQYGASGEAMNTGTAIGDLSGTWSNTTKHVYGGGDALSGPLGAGATAYSGSHFETMGGAGAIDMGYGGSQAGTSETGSVAGGGFVLTGGNWSYGVGDDVSGGNGGSGCNAGVGNGSEGCDPGNSGNTPAGGVDDD